MQALALGWIHSLGSDNSRLIDVPPPGGPDPASRRVRHQGLGAGAKFWAASGLPALTARVRTGSVVDRGSRKSSRGAIGDLSVWQYGNIIMDMNTLSTPERMRFRRQSQVLKALANESRLLIVDRLQHGECSAGELTRLVCLDQSTVSKHLAILRAQGIVEDRRQGSTVIYRLRTLCVTQFLSCASQVLGEPR